MAAEPTITCPKCRTEIKLTESLAAPLIESTRRDFENRLAQQNAEVAKREQAIQSRLWPTPGRYASDADLPVLPDKDGNYAVPIPGIYKPY